MKNDMDFKEYIATVNQKYQQGNATEHTYRGTLESCIAAILPELSVTNEGKRERCGALRANRPRPTADGTHHAGN